MRHPFARLITRALLQTLPHLAILAVMLLAFAPQSGSFWECEGQKCGISSWACCCAAPLDTKDANCGEAKTHFSQGEHASEAGPCAVDCHCSKVVQERTQSISSAIYSFASPVFFVAPLKFEPTFEAPVFTESPRPRIARGPPPESVYLASSPLRGPPVA